MFIAILSSESNDWNWRIKPESLDGTLLAAEEMGRDDNRGIFFYAQHDTRFVCLCFFNFSFIDRAFRFTPGAWFLEQPPWFWHCTIVG